MATWDLLCIASQSSPCTRVPSFDAFLHQGPSLFLQESLHQVFSILFFFSPAPGANEVGVGDGAIEAGQADDMLAGHRHRLDQDGETDGAHHLEVHTDSQMYVLTFTSAGKHKYK